MNRTLPFVFFLHVSPATADMLLKEFPIQTRYDGGVVSDPPPIGVTFGIGLGTSTIETWWADIYSPDQIGKTFEMPPELRANWQAVLDHPPNGGVWFYARGSVPEAFGNHHGDTLASAPLGSYEAQTGTAYGTDDWRLTRVTRTIDSFSWDVGRFCSPGTNTCDPATTPYSVLAGGAYQTIRLYGPGQVPEPSTVVLSAFAISVLSTYLRKRN